MADAGPDRTGTVNVAITLDGGGSSDPDGTIVAYWWSFGNGTSTTIGTPSVTWTYTAVGTYTATLWVRDNLGAWSLASDSATVTIGSSTGPSTTSSSTSTSTSTSRPTTTSSPVSTTTLPNQAPNANAGPDQFTQTLTTITLNGASSSDPDGSIVSASWSFGDGTTGGGLTPTKSYATAGTYTATLTVTDNRGAVDTDTAVVTVSNRPPTAEAGPNANGPPNTPVGLNGSDSDDPDGVIVGWAWNFGDGATGTGAMPTHTYAAPGTYTARLTVTDNHGASANDSTTVTIAAAAPWARAIGSTSSDAVYAVAVDGSGNTVVAGSYRGTVNFGGTTLTSAGGADAFVAKYGTTGTLLWARSMGGPSDDVLDSIALDGNGDVAASGRFAGTASFGGTALVSNGTSDIVVAKYLGTTGAHVWSKRFGGPYDDAASAVGVDGSGNVYATGYFRGTVDFGGGLLSVPFVTDLDVFLLKLSAAGAHVWSKNFANDGNDRGYGLAVDASGNVAITGYFSNTINFGGSALVSVNAMTDVFVARFTATGLHSWSRRFGAADGSESGYAVALDGSGNVHVTGYLSKAADLGGGTLAALGGTDAFVAKYGATNGSHLWSRRLGGLANDYGYGVAVDPSTGAVYVAGSFDDVAAFGGASLTSLGLSDAFVAKYGSTGTLAWAKRSGGTNADVARAVQLRGGSLAFSGYFSGTGTFEAVPLTSAGLADGFVVRSAP